MKALIIIIILILLIGGGFYYWKQNAPGDEIACTMDAMQCPDGSYVGRVAPSCDFAPCPVTTGTTTGQMEDGTVPAGSGIDVGPADEPLAPAAKTVTITYTDSGFSPSAITINKGDTVKFVNQSSGAMWVASAPHPQHTDYAAFDEKQGVSKGGTYSFTFDRVGVHKFHNHLNSSRFGSVTVQ